MRRGQGNEGRDHQRPAGRQGDGGDDQAETERAGGDARRPGRRRRLHRGRPERGRRWPAAAASLSPPPPAGGRWPRDEDGQQGRGSQDDPLRRPVVGGAGDELVAGAAHDVLGGIRQRTGRSGQEGNLPGGYGDAEYRTTHEPDAPLQCLAPVTAVPHSSQSLSVQPSCQPRGRTTARRPCPPSITSRPTWSPVVRASGGDVSDISRGVR